jgi:site-specific recombinase XerD
MDDPFLGEWEQIHAYVHARPMASAGEILREWQRRFPERFVDAHLNILQRRLREIRASLAVPQTTSSVGQMDGATASRASSELPSTREALSPGADIPRADAPTIMWPDPAAVPSFLLPTSEEETRPAPRLQISVAEASSSKKEAESQHIPTVQEPPVVGSADGLPTRMITIDHIISLFLQGKHTRGWEPKTREWHETSLGQLQRYLAWRGVILLSSLTGSEIRGWLTFLRTEALATGAFRVQSTLSTYARSVHAFCAWLVVQGHLEQSPFTRMKVPKGTKRCLHFIEEKTFERLLHACHVVRTKRATMDYATARNRALLWVLWDTGLLVSEVCALNMEDVDLAQGTLYVQGRGPRGRSLPLTPQVRACADGVRDAVSVARRKRRCA